MGESPLMHLTPGDLAPLAAVLAVATAAYVWRERRRRRTLVRPAYPDIEVAQVWENWLAGIRETPDLVLAPPGTDDLAEPLGPRALAGLVETGCRCASAEHPRIALRQAILEAATLGLHLEVLLEADETERRSLLKGYQEGMEPWLRESFTLATVHWLVLRQYGQWKYDDAAPDDWFHRFFRVARPYIREKMRVAREYLLEGGTGSPRLIEIYDQLLTELADLSLRAAPKRRFARPDLPWDARRLEEDPG